MCQDVGELINNSIALYTDGDAGLNAIVCNNDNGLYFVDVAPERIEITQRMKFAAPLNHASISPSRKTIVACGDTQQIYLCPRDGDRPYSAGTGRGRTSSGTDSNSGAGWNITETLGTWSDYGFSTGFHNSGVVFGVAFQPGVAQLFDMRNLSEPLTQIYSTRPKEWPGAFRCLKFSGGPEDLMFVSEQMGRVHVVDLRNFENHQVLMVPEELSSLGGNSDHFGQNTNETGESVINLYEDMLKSGEAVPPVVNELEVHQMFSDQPVNSNILDYDEYPPLPGDTERRGSSSEDSAILEDEDMRVSPSESWAGVTPNMRRASTSMISADSGIRDLRMDGVSLSNSRSGGGGGVGLQLSPTVAPLQSSSSQLPNLTSVAGSGYSVYYLSRHVSRRMSQATLINSLRYLTSASGSGSGGLAHSSSYGAPAYRFDAGLHHHPPHHIPSSSRSSQTEHGVSGIAWTEYEGGKLVVGSDNGVGVWDIDGVARRTFPDYERR